MSGVSVVRILRGNDVTPLPVRYVSGPAAFLVTGYVNCIPFIIVRGKKKKKERNTIQLISYRGVAEERLFLLA